MSTFDRLAGFADSITNAKQVDVSTATSQKQAAQGQSPFQLTPENAYNFIPWSRSNLGYNIIMINIDRCFYLFVN